LKSRSREFSGRSAVAASQLAARRAHTRESPVSVIQRPERRRSAERGDCLTCVALTRSRSVPAAVLGRSAGALRFAASAFRASQVPPSSDPCACSMAQPRSSPPRARRTRQAVRRDRRAGPMNRAPTLAISSSAQAPALVRARKSPGLAHLQNRYPLITALVEIAIVGEQQRGSPARASALANEPIRVVGLQVLGVGDRPAEARKQPGARVPTAGQLRRIGSKVGVVGG